MRLRYLGLNLLLIEVESFNSVGVFLIGEYDFVNLIKVEKLCYKSKIGNSFNCI